MKAFSILAAVLLAVAACAIVSATAQAMRIATPVNPALERLQRQIVHDRDQGKRGKLKLGALSDGYFDVFIDERNVRVVIKMPPLRAKRLKATRRLVAERYGDAPVKLQLAPRVRPRRLRDPGTAPKPGEPFICRGDLIAVGLPGRAGGSPSRRATVPVGWNETPLPAATWNAKRIIGKRVTRAQRMALRHDCGVRPVLVDGMAIGITMDYRSNRINVAVRDGRVTQILSLG